MMEEWVSTLSRLHRWGLWVHTPCEIMFNLGMVPRRNTEQVREAFVEWDFWESEGADDFVDAFSEIVGVRVDLQDIIKESQGDRTRGMFRRKAIEEILGHLQK